MSEDIKTVASQVVVDEVDSSVGLKVATELKYVEIVGDVWVGLKVATSHTGNEGPKVFDSLKSVGDGIKVVVSQAAIASDAIDEDASAIPLVQISEHGVVVLLPDNLKLGVGGDGEFIMSE